MPPQLWDTRRGIWPSLLPRRWARNKAVKRVLEDKANEGHLSARAGRWPESRYATKAIYFPNLTI